MSLPLPYVIVPENDGDLVDAEAVQANFDAIKKAFPLSRKDLTLESSHVVGDPGEPVFENSWANYDTAAWQGARFWKDPMGIVHVEGLVNGGTVSASGVVFTLPAGYRPGSGLIFATYTSSGVGRITLAPTGGVIAEAGGNTWFSVNCSFRQEQ